MQSLTASTAASSATTAATAAAVIRSVSCAAAGSCAAGGTYLNASHHGQAFVVTQANGTWGTAREVPGTATLNKGGYAHVNSVSCGAAGNCSAGGVYTDSSQRWQAFAVSES